MPRPTALYVCLAAWLLTVACEPTNPAVNDNPAAISTFCTALKELNSGRFDVEGGSELAGHVRIIKRLAGQAPSSLSEDLARIEKTIGAWAEAVSGEQSMIDTFEILSDPKLIGSEGRVSDFIALHCGIDLGGPQWVEAEPPATADKCPAWPRLGTPLTFNHFPNLPDIAGSNYFGQNFLISGFLSTVGIKNFKNAFVVEPGGKAVIHGQYPKARYFAFHPNDMDLNNLQTLRDKDLQPDPGSVNPFQKVDSGDQSNYYTASLVFSATPAELAANTSYVGKRKDGKTENKFVLNMLRMYHVDAGNGAGSGEVPLPALTIYDADGDIQQHFDECDFFAAGEPEIKTAQVFPALPIIDYRARNPPQWSTSSNFNAPSDTLANADVQYLATHYSERFGSLFVTRAKYLTAPDTRAGESPAATDKQVRLYNLCTYNFWNGGANQCLLENELLRDDAGFYTVVISKATDKPANLRSENATWMDWGPYLDGQLQYRYVYRDNPLVMAIASAADGKPIDAELSSYVPISTPCDKATFENGGWRACFDLHGRNVSTYK